MILRNQGGWLLKSLMIKEAISTNHKFDWYHFEIISRFQPVILSTLLSNESPIFLEETRWRIKGGTALLPFIPRSISMCSCRLVFTDSQCLPSPGSVQMSPTDFRAWMHREGCWGCLLGKHSQIEEGSKGAHLYAFLLNKFYGLKNVLKIKPYIWSQ